MDEELELDGNEAYSAEQDEFEDDDADDEEDGD